MQDANCSFGAVKGLNLVFGMWVINSNSHQVFVFTFFLLRRLVHVLFKHFKVLKLLLVPTLVSAHRCIRPSAGKHGLIEQILELLILCELFNIEYLRNKNLNVLIVGFIFNNLWKLKSVNLWGHLPLNVKKDLLLDREQVWKLLLVWLSEVSVFSHDFRVWKQGFVVLYLLK